MRYPEDIPREQLAMHASDDMVLFTVVIGLVVGFILTGLGWYGRQIWLMFWAVGLIFASIAYLVAYALGYT